MRVFALLLALSLGGSAWAEGGGALTLEEALAAAEAAHPELELAEAERDMARADERLASARQDLSVSLEAGLRRVGPSLVTDGRTALDDHSVRLMARKSLYDFGRTAAGSEAARLEVGARDAALLDARDRRRIEVMGRFFDVLLADLQAAADNEYMAVAYVDFDNGRDRLAVGKISAVDLAALESRYQELLVKRNASQSRQRIARALLANAMNQTGRLPTDLVEPRLPRNDRPLPEYDELLPLMMAGNSRLKAAQNQAEAARQRIEAARAERGPSLDAEMEAADYATRRLNGRDQWRLGLVLSLPLYQGERVDARVAREQAQFHKAQASVEKLRMELTQALLETWLEIEQLRNVTRAAARKQSDYRDLALEKARAEYEVELKTNLGTSMAATMEAKVNERRAEYRLALAWARLESLLGAPLPDAPADKEPVK